MKVLLFCNTNNTKSGTGAVVNNLVERLGNQLLVLSESNESVQFPIVCESIMETPNFPKRGARYFRWLYLFKFRQAKKKCAELIASYQPDVIMTIYPNEYFLLLAAQVAKKHHLPLVTWFHNTYVENRSGIDRLFGKYVQRKIFQQSALILTISNGLTEYYKANYPVYSNKFDTLQHGFAALNTQKGVNTMSSTGNKVRMAFTGSLNSSCLDASTRLFKALSQLSNVELNIFSGYPEQSFEKIIPDELEYVYHGFIPEDDFIAKIQECDIALIAHGFKGSLNDVEYRTIFPTRTIPLLQSGIPILLHSPDSASYTEFMRENNCALIVDQADEAQIIEGVQRLLQESILQQLLVNNAKETATYFDIKSTSQKLVNYINSLS